MQWDLALYDLIVPYVLRAAPLGAIHAAVSAIFVHEYDEAASDQGVVVRGTARISGQAGAFFDPSNGTFAANVQNIEGHPRDDSGRRQPWIDLKDTEIEFQLHATREASAIVTGGAGALDNTNDADTIAVLNRLDSSPAAPAFPPVESDYPSTTFSLDMVITGAVLRPPFLHGAELQPDGNLLPVSGDDTVEITLPRFKIHLAQGPMVGAPLIVDLLSFGATGLDDPGDVAVAELIKMTPPYAFIGNGQTVGIGFERAVLDLSNQSTPPEVLEQFGYDDAWTGLFLPDLRLFVAPNGLEDFAVSAGAHNLLIGFGPQGGISGDFDLAIIDQGGDDLSISARFVDREGTVYGIEHLPGGASATATASIPMFTQMIVDVTGGLPPYAITVAPSVEVDIDESNQRVHNVTLTPDPGRIEISATDSRGLSRELIITLNHRTSPAVRLPGGGVRAPTIDDQTSTRNGIDVDSPEIVIIGYTKDEVNLALRPPLDPNVGIEWRVDGESSDAARVLSVTLDPGGGFDVSAQFTMTPAANDEVTAFFRYNQPGLGDAVGESGMNATEAIDEGTYSPWVDGPSSVFETHLETFEAIDPDETITITGFASYEGQDADEDPGNKVRGNYDLARRRALAFQAAISERLPILRFQILPEELQGTDFPTDWATDWRNQDGDQQSYWRADAAMQVSTALVDFVAAARVTRPQAAPVPAQPEPPEDPEPPPWFHSIAAKVRIVRDTFVAIELSGEVDFQTAIEEQLNSPNDEPGPGEDHIVIPLVGLGNNTSDGVVTYRVLVQVDDATGEWIVSAAVGADPADIDGLVRTRPGDSIDEEVAARERLGRNMLGMTTAMAPVLAAVAPANPLNGEIAPLVVGGLVLGVLNGLAIGRILNVERVILYGAEAIVRQRSSGPEINLLFDVETAISAQVVLGGSELLTIPADNPLVVRYKAIGVRLGYTPPEHRFQFRPVFDASKGYTLDLAGPGGIQVGEPLGRILKVLGARMARTNPLNFEIDLGFSVDLGVVAVERARVRLPLDPDPIRPPELTALAASIDIPGALRARGYLEIGTAETANGAPPAREIRGGLDLTIIPVGLRVSAEIAIAQIPEGPAGGPATGVAVSIEVTFPTALPLGSSGLGLIGLLGLFAMHYGRNEDNFLSHPTPALSWLEATGGNPTKLSSASGDESSDTPLTHFWTPQIDRWAFGVGAVLGSLEGGTVFNLKGIFLLELPGPRILMMMKAALLTPPPVVEGVAEAAGSVLAVLDLDVGRGTLTIGLIAEYGVEPLINIRIPVEAFFNLKEATDWHIYLGTAEEPIQAKVISAFDGSGYLMLNGEGLALEGFYDVAGFAIGMGLHVELIWGNKEVRIYASVAGGFDALVGFDPFSLQGQFFLRGQLRFLIFSVAAWAGLNITIRNDPETGERTTLVDGEICGEIKITRRRRLKACIDFELGSGGGTLIAPPLVEKMSIVSRGPALVSGSGADQPIDAVLAQGILADTQPDAAVFEPDPDDLDAAAHPRVPIDSILAFGLAAPARSAGEESILGTTISDSPGNTPDGWITRGKVKLRYEITGVRLIHGGLSDGEVPVAWWSNKPGLEESRSLQLAIFTWSPDPTPAAIERGEFLRRKVAHRWGTVCHPAAPAAPVLWSFHRQDVGPSDDGWTVEGVAWPDPDETVRSDGPDLGLLVAESWRSGNPIIDAWRGIQGGAIEGSAVPCAKGTEDENVPGGSRRSPGLVLAGGNAEGRPNNAPGPRETAMEVRHAINQFTGARPADRIPRLSTSVASALNSLAVGAPIDRAAFLRAAARGAVHEVAANDADQNARANAPLCDAKVLSAPMFDIGGALLGTSRIVPFGDEAREAEITAAWDEVGFVPSELFDAVRIYTGPIVEGRFLIRCHRFRLELEMLVIRVLDELGDEIRRQVPTTAQIVTLEGLPDRWRNEDGPWCADVEHAFAFAPDTTVPTAVVMVDLPNVPQAAVVEIGFRVNSRIPTAANLLRSFQTRPFHILCFELIRMGEAIREDYDARQLIEDQQAIGRYLQLGAGDQAMLEYDTVYGVRIEWTSEIEDEDVQTGEETFWFRTELAPPPRLGQYISYTAPNEREQHVFGHEPLKLLFSTPQVFNLYNQGGRDLQVRLRAASFRTSDVIPIGPDASDGPADFEMLPPLVVTPFEETVRQLLDGSCVEFDAESVSVPLVTLNIGLDPLTDYVLEIEAIPALEPVDDGEPDRTVVHTISFTTGRYPLLEAFAGAIGSTLATHRWIGTGEIANFLEQFESRQPQGAEFDAALHGAGLDPAMVPERPRIMVLWEQPGEASPEPVAILIDAPEPMERSWDVPQLVTEQLPGEDSERSWWQPVPTRWLQLEAGEESADRIRRIVVAPGGQRALVILGAGSRGERVQVTLVRPSLADQISVVTGDAESFAIVDLVLDRAPWEE